MTIGTEKFFKVHTSTGAAVFTYDFTLPSSTELEVWRRALDGTETIVDPTLFTLDTSARNVTFSTPPPAGERICLLRRTKRSQGAQFSGQGTWDPEVFGEALDRLTRISQEVDSKGDDADAGKMISKLPRSYFGNEAESPWQLINSGSISSGTGIVSEDFDSRYFTQIRIDLHDAKAHNVTGYAPLFLQFRGTADGTTWQTGTLYSFQTTTTLDLNAQGIDPSAPTISSSSATSIEIGDQGLGALSAGFGLSATILLTFSNDTSATGAAGDVIVEATGTATRSTGHYRFQTFGTFQTSAAATANNWVKSFRLSFTDFTTTTGNVNCRFRVSGRTGI